jgi:hypothetical protein
VLEQVTCAQALKGLGDMRVHQPISGRVFLSELIFAFSANHLNESNNASSK